MPVTIADVVAAKDEAVKEIERLRAENDRLRAALKECADDLESAVEHQYDKVKDHPAMTRRYERDIQPVHIARKLLANEQKADTK